MVVKLYISGISGNKEVKKRQQRVMMILDSKNIKYDVIDITEPGREADKDFMQSNSKSNGGTVSDPNPRSPLPPQLFNDEEYCGDYDEFDLANEVDTLEQFLKMEVPPEELPAENEKGMALNGDVDGTNKDSDAHLNDETNTESTEDEGVKEETETKVKEVSPTKESSPSREAESKASKEGTPVPNEAEDNAVDTKEKSPEKEAEDNAVDTKEKSPEKEPAERQKSVEKKDIAEVSQSPEKEINVTPNEVKENSPEEAINENGTVSSREQSQEKVVEQIKDNPSEALIQSEQASAAE